MEGLKTSEQEAQEIVDAIPQTIAVLSPDGQPLYGNRSLLQYTGLTIAEMTSADFRGRVFHPEDVARLREERRDALARGVPFELEQRARRHDGQYRWFLVQYNPVRDEHGQTLRWYATGTDIDDRKRTEERTQSENLALREDIDRASMFEEIDRKSTRLNSSHLVISYAVFCLKKKNKILHYSCEHINAPERIVSTTASKYPVLRSSNRRPGAVTARLSKTTPRHPNASGDCMTS